MALLGFKPLPFEADPSLWVLFPRPTGAHIPPSSFKAACHSTSSLHCSPQRVAQSHAPFRACSRRFCYLSCMTMVARTVMTCVHALQAAALLQGLLVRRAGPAPDRQQGAPHSGNPCQRGVMPQAVGHGLLYMILLVRSRENSRQTLFLI